MSELPYAAALQAHSLLDALTTLVLDAARLVAKESAGVARIRRKADGSPVTAVDEAAEAMLLDGLRRILPGTPVVSEESSPQAPVPPKDAVFALVDPLDGTREFLAGRAEYTVNLALVASGVPVIGLIAAPALNLLWRGTVGRGAERLGFGAESAGRPERIAARRWRAGAPRALVSRSHLDAETAAFVARIAGVEQEPCGSALKFCRLAEGDADIYARLAPTCEWDIAAGDALLSAAGGVLLGRDGRPLSYGDAGPDYRVPAFIAYADPAAAEQFGG